MIDTTFLDPVGAVLAELRADTDVSALAGGRIRGGEPAPGDAKGPGEYRAFLVLVTFDDPPHPRVNVQRAVYGVNCYGVTHQGSRELWGAVVKAMHVVGSRMKANGLGIYISAIESGGESDLDPLTKQPVTRGTLRLWATAQAVA
jgi:hypothetical protein